MKTHQGVSKALLIFSLAFLSVYKNYLYNETKLQMNCSLQNMGCSGSYDIWERIFVLSQRNSMKTVRSKTIRSNLTKGNILCIRQQSLMNKQVWQLLQNKRLRYYYKLPIERNNKIVLLEKKHQNQYTKPTGGCAVIQDTLIAISYEMQ